MIRLKLFSGLFEIDVKLEFFGSSKLGSVEHGNGSVEHGVSFIWRDVGDAG
jgi:hypothetical protein